MINPFIVFCTYVISERIQNMDLLEMRSFLDEIDDFDEEQRRIISECPELQTL